MTNRLGQGHGAAFSSTSTADLLANQLETQADDGEETAEPKALQLEKQVGLIGSVSLIVGTMIGSGIFASASGVFGYAGSVGLSLVVWGGCGVIAMLGALCYAELGTMIPKSGAEFAYLLEAFGEPGAFLYSWTSVTLLKPSQMAIIALAFGKYVVEPFFPSCMSQDPDRQDLNVLVKLMAALCIGKSFVSSVCFTDRVLQISHMMLSREIALKVLRGGGGGGPPYKSYMGACAAVKGMVFKQFSLG